MALRPMPAFCGPPNRAASAAQIASVLPNCLAAPSDVVAATLLAMSLFSDPSAETKPEN